MSNVPQQKYVKGSFLLEENVDDSKAYYEQHKAKVAYTITVDGDGGSA